MSATSRIRLSAKERLSLFSDMSTMYSAGIPIIEIIEALEHDTQSNMRKVLRRLYKALTNGQPLSHAMDELPKSFDPITINTIRAAEAGGTLEDSLQNIVSSTKKEMAFTDNIRMTMIYPAFVMVIFSAIIILMLTFVIPRISKVFGQMRINMPWITKAMFAASDYFLAHWVAIILGIAAAIVLAAVYISTHKRTIANLLLSVPGLRDLGRDIDLARFNRSLALLLHAGIPLDRSLSMASGVVQKNNIRQVIADMQRDIENGQPMSESLPQASRVIPPIMRRSLATAERSGTLEQTVTHLADYFDEQVTNGLKLISNLLEPILIIVVGIMVGTLMVSIIGPMYNLISQIDPHK